MLLFMSTWNAGGVPLIFWLILASYFLSKLKAHQQSNQLHHSSTDNWFDSVHWDVHAWKGNIQPVNKSRIEFKRKKQSEKIDATEPIGQKIDKKRITWHTTCGGKYNTQSLPMFFWLPLVLIGKWVLLIPDCAVLEHRTSPYPALTSAEHCRLRCTKAGRAVWVGEIQVTSSMSVGKSIRKRWNVEEIVVLARWRSPL